MNTGNETTGNEIALPNLPIFDLTGWLQHGQIGRGRTFRKQPYSRDGQVVVLAEYHFNEAFIEPTANQLDYVGIARWLGKCTRDDHICIVQEYVSGTNLQKLMAPGKWALSWNAVRNILQAIAGVLAFTHSKGFGHYDLTDANVLFTEDWQVKVSDFITSPAPESDTCMTVSDSDIWKAPEISLGVACDMQADIFSLGLLAVYLLTKKYPPRRVPLRDYAADPVRIATLLPEGFPVELWELTKDCLTFEPSKRSTASQVRDRLAAMELPGEPKPVAI